ncbi:MAG: rhomboid family intramembrane serine protease [Thermonemataceae bacterium]|nr:rhomboid family intramembrane serine protease [Thermonemataceae bacterium]
MIEITYIIIGATVVTSLLAWQQPKLLNQWIFYPYAIRKNKEWLRFLTSGFIHSDYMHLIFNMISLFFLGKYAEFGFMERFGVDSYILVYVFFYLSAIIVSDIPTFFKQSKNPHYRALGASGAVSAVVFATILMEPGMRLRVFPIPFPIPGVVYALLYIFYSAYMAKNARDNIGHDAHLYGSLYGLAFVGVLMPDKILQFLQSLQNLIP